jgi:glucose-6-phosphate 1-dehydrogenase
VFVIFGATGDLARRKLFPGLFRLYRSRMLPERFAVIGSGRNSPGSDEEFRHQLAEAVRKFTDDFADDAWHDFARHISFCCAAADQSDELVEKVRVREEEVGEGVQRLVYLSVPPNAMEPMVAMLGESGLSENSRLVLEKPFGSDLQSCRELNRTLHRYFAEDRLFRIDHFIGKEAVQNILVLRFANGLFEPAWNRTNVCYVQIDVPEEIGIEGRSAFMESTGTFRDMVCTHLCQLLGFVAFEPPLRISAESLRSEKRKVFQALRPLDPSRVVFGQYEGYREEDGVADDSRVETFVALEAWVDNWRWKGVPFYLRTGKALAATRRTITLGFIDPPLKMFPASAEYDEQPNELVFELTDDPKLTVDIRAKHPGPSLELDHAQLQLRFSEAFADAEPLEAYERLLLDVMRGDQMLFTSAEEVERLWEVSDPVLRSPPKPRAYPRHSWGPKEALELPGRRGWRVPEA